MTQEDTTIKTPRRGQYFAEIVDHKPYAIDHMQLQLKLTEIAALAFRKARPGQFIQITCHDLNHDRTYTPLLRRPISIADLDINEDSCIVTIIYRIVGPGTTWLSERKVGEKIDILGPLGQPFKLPQDKNQKCILLGGGIGLPPMFFLAHTLQQEGYENRLAFAAARGHTNLQNSFLMDAIDPEHPLKPGLSQINFNQSQTLSILATDDGTCGFHGTIVDALYLFLKLNPDWEDTHLFACGPKPMLRAIGQFSIERRMPCQVCLEAYMACGIGLCQSCAVAFNDLEDINASIKDAKYKLVCVNGPVFNAWNVDWEEDY